jgi:broad specificity phosphatase PhoE
LSEYRNYKIQNMKRIWFVRHAESVANAGGKTSSPADTELTKDGQKQADELAEKVTDKPELIITSPYIRTLRTAEPLIAKFPDTRHEQWSVQEFTYLSPSKYNNTTMEERVPMALEYWDRNDPEYCDGQGAESFTDFLKRVRDCKKKLANLKENYVIIFSHYQFIAAYNWLNDSEQSAITPEQMADFRQHLLSNKLENAGILKCNLERQ